MKRKFLSCLIAVIMVFSASSLPASALSVKAADISTVSPRIIHSYDKTVTNTYSNFNDIPEMISYSEYNDQWQSWFTGVLSLQSATKKNNMWYTTYTGSISGQI